MLLTIDVPDHLVLLSDFDLWHCVLNNWYLSREDEDDDAPHSQEEIEASWENIFLWDEEFPGWRSSKSTQATFWELKREWVRKTEFFVSI